MASFDAYTAIKSWLELEWGGEYEILGWEEVSDTLSDGGLAFIALEEQPAREDIVAIAGIRPAVEERVTFSVHLFVPAGGDYIGTRQLANEIATMGRQLQLTEDRENANRIVRVHPPNPGIANDGLWSSMIVEIELARWIRANVERIA